MEYRLPANREVLGGSYVEVERARHGNIDLSGSGKSGNEYAGVRPQRAVKGTAPLVFFTVEIDKTCFLFVTVTAAHGIELNLAGQDDALNGAGILCGDSQSERKMRRRRALQYSGAMYRELQIGRCWHR